MAWEYLRAALHMMILIHASSPTLLNSGAQQQPGDLPASKPLLAGFHHKQLYIQSALSTLGEW